MLQNIMGSEEQFLTPEQHMKILRDQAMFSDAFTAKREAIEQLAEKYGTAAIPIIEEVVSTIHTSYDPLELFCIERIKRILKNRKRKLESAGQ